MARLITGGSGLIGAELARQLISLDEQIIVFDVVKNRRLKDLNNNFTFIMGDVANWPEVMNSVKGHKITHIYHLAARLTADSEANPWVSFNSNILGSFNILEAARLFDIKKLMFASSIGTYDYFQKDVIDDFTLQRPDSMYGAGKLYVEGLGRFYRKKFNLDFRSVRYPSVIGPGVSTGNHWDVPMIQSSIEGKPYQCPVSARFRQPALYYKDAARAAYQILEAPSESIITINYNITGTAVFSAMDMQKAIQQQFPEFNVKFNEKGLLPALKTWDDGAARKEWGWKPQYPDLSTIIKAYLNDIKVWNST
jgi:threonine 3-dehydrogenase